MPGNVLLRTGLILIGKTEAFHLICLTLDERSLAVKPEDNMIIKTLFFSGVDVAC